MALHHGNRRPKILVLGCGIVGLNTALRLQEDYPQASITIMAEKMGQGVVSNVAAGFFRASTSIRGPSEALTKAWIKNAWDYYQQLRLKAKGGDTGIAEIPLYMLTSSGIPPANNGLMKGLTTVRECSPAELNLFMPRGKYQQGSYTKTLVISPDCHIPWALSMFRGPLIERRIETWNDLLDDEPYDVVVNCTGLGSASLASDKTLSPIRGQVWKVKAPWIKVAVYADNDTYIIPGIDDVTLGGCRQYDNYNENVDGNDSQAIWQRVTTLMPNLKKARVVCEAVGLRPHRGIVRVEQEVVRLRDGSNLPIVHHYGHCGYGVMISPGTAITASELVGQVLKNHH